MTLLILGGTREAKQLACTLIDEQIDLIYSVAGLVRQPELNCQIISGGFRQYGGLTPFILQQQITALLDATHTFAVNISQAAAAAARQTNRPYWRYERPVWRQQPNDRWQFFNDFQQLRQLLQGKRRLFLTTGQPEESVIAAMATQADTIFFRTAIKPDIALPANVIWRQGIGPFMYQAEYDFMQQHRIDALITKHSGGEATVAKIDAARALGIAVFLQQRPSKPSAQPTFATVAECQAFITAHYLTTRTN